MIAQKVTEPRWERVLGEVCAADQDIVQWRTGVTRGGGYNCGVAAECNGGVVNTYVVETEVWGLGEEFLERRSKHGAHTFYGG